jgi:phosphatidylinositol-bisphosphatase
MLPRVAVALTFLGMRCAVAVAVRGDVQLTTERRRLHCFEGFDEAKITFKPTYKYQAGTDRYDERPEKTIRSPAWCDRVLWRSTDGGVHMRALFYGRTEQVRARARAAVLTARLLDVRLLSRRAAAEAL